MSLLYLLWLRRALKHRGRQRAASPWLNSVADEELAERLLQDQFRNNPVFRAAILSEITGLQIRPEDVQASNPGDILRKAIVRRALRQVTGDEYSIAEAREPFARRWKTRHS